MQTSADTSRSHPRRAATVALPFAVIVLAMLPAVLDQTILATALPTIAGDLGQLADLSWIVTAYVIAAAATTPLWGKLGDRYGRKLLLEIALACSLRPPRSAALPRTSPCWSHFAQSRERPPAG